MISGTIQINIEVIVSLLYSIIEKLTAQLWHTKLSRKDITWYFICKSTWISGIWFV